MDHDANIRNVDPHAECASRANNVKLVRALANAQDIEETARLQFGDRLGADHAAALRDQIAADRLILHMTDITLAEVRRQLTDDVGEAAIAVKNARRHFGRWKKRLPKIGLQDVPDFDQAAVSAAAFEDFQRAARQDWRAVDHVATDVPGIRSEVVVKDGVGAAAQFAAVLGPDALAPVAVAAGLGRQQVEQGVAVARLGSRRLALDRLLEEVRAGGFPSASACVGSRSSREPLSRPLS